MYALTSNLGPWPPLMTRLRPSDVLYRNHLYRICDINALFLRSRVQAGASYRRRMSYRSHLYCCPVPQFIRGMYALFLEVWLRHFPRDHVLVLKSEDFFADAGGTLAKARMGVRDWQ